MIISCTVYVCNVDASETYSVHSKAERSSFWIPKGGSIVITTIRPKHHMNIHILLTQAQRNIVSLGTMETKVEFVRTNVYFKH